MDIQGLVPEAYREVVEVAPRGFFKSGLTGAILFGALIGGVGGRLLPDSIALAVFLVLLVVQQAWKWRSDRLFDKRMAELEDHDSFWKP